MNEGEGRNKLDVKRVIEEGDAEVVERLTLGDIAVFGPDVGDFPASVGRRHAVR